MVTQSDVVSLSFEETRPAYTLQSGPVAGVLASKSEGALLDTPNIVTTDVGGTSFDVGLVADGDWVNAREPIVDAFHVGFPMVEVESIGAGGGSIAWVDEGGALNVGPRSAGASPGPACYGAGGTEPTVTDAAVLLGYVNPSNFLGGRMKLDVSLAEKAIAKVADQIGMDTTTTAAGIFQIANTHMSALVGRRVLARGYDPRDFVLYSYGGAGPVHSGFYAEELGVKKVVVPALAGTFSSMGVATGALHRSARLTDFAPMPMPPEELNSRFERLHAEVSHALDEDGIPEEARRIVYALDMRYGVQVHTVTLRLPAGPFDEARVTAAGDAFDELYERLFGRGSGFVQAGRFVTAFIVEGFGDLQIPDRAKAGDDASQGLAAAHIGDREAYFDGGYTSTAIYDFGALSTGAEIAGPSIIEAPTTTVVVPPGQNATVDDYRNIHLEPAAAAAHGS
jgi:N-methylhydantoinase A